MTGGRDTRDDRPAVSSRVLLVSGQRLDPRSIERAIRDHHGREIDAVVGVLADCSASDWLSVWAETPVRTTTIDVETCTRSTSRTAEQPTAPSAQASLSDISERLLDSFDTQEGQMVCCLHSLSTLLERFEREHVFRFVHAVGVLAARHGEACYLTMNASRQDAATTEVFSTICDVVRVDRGDTTPS